MQTKRNYKIDILRALSIILIVLAHSEPPNLIFQLRSFDVVLMTLMMSVSFYLSYKNESYITYVVKRFKRLIVPVWIFLTIFFAFFFILNIFIKSSFVIDIGLIVKSYSLLSGIGYVWIIRIFFTISILNPFLLKFSNKTKSTISKISVIIILLALQQLSASSVTDATGIKYVIFNLILSNSFGYMIISLAGMYMIKQSKRDNILMVFLFFIMFIFSIFFFKSFDINLYKYPPQLLYLSYGLSISFLLWNVLSFEKVENIFRNNVVSWFSTNSLNIYYWHIISIYLINYYVDINFWVYKFLFILLSSVVITLLQNKFLPNLFKIK